MTDIYKITNLLNGKCYIGQTRKGYKNRFKQHCLPWVKTYIGRAIQKNGKDNFELKLIAHVDDSQANNVEIHCIKIYKGHWKLGGYNLSLGGDYNPMFDPKVRKHFLERIHDPEVMYRKRISSLGRKVSEITRKKISDSNKSHGRCQVRGLLKANRNKSISVYMIQLPQDVIIRKFDSLQAACKFIIVQNNISYTDLNRKAGSMSGKLKLVVNRYNKSGKRSKMWGYAWVSPSVETIPIGK